MRQRGRRLQRIDRLFHGSGFLFGQGCFHHGAVRQHHGQGPHRAGLHAGGDAFAVLLAPGLAHVAAHGHLPAGALGHGLRVVGAHVRHADGVQRDGAVGADGDTKFAGHAELNAHVDAPILVLLQGPGGADGAAGRGLALMAAHRRAEAFGLDHLHARDEHVAVLHGLLEAHAVVGRDAGHFTAAAGAALVRYNLNMLNHAFTPLPHQGP